MSQESGIRIYLWIEALFVAGAHAGTMNTTSSTPAISTDVLLAAEHLTRVVGRTESRIVDDVSFRVPRHTLFAINGPSGSGKTTLLNLVTGIDHPTRGTITFDGQHLQAVTEDALARWRGRHVGIRDAVAATARPAQLEQQFGRLQVVHWLLLAILCVFIHLVAAGFSLRSCRSAG